MKSTSLPGNWKPHLDVSGAAGKRAYDVTVGAPATSPRFYEGGVRAELSQLLWDGLATHNEVERLGHAKLERYFEFLDSTEQFGLEAAKAYYDVVRYRKLVALAEDNYIQHKYSFDQVQSRVNAGVGRGVDLEQVIARVALAESNLVTERANLHDVTERYVRIVGSVPPAENVSAVSMVKQLPGDRSRRDAPGRDLQSPAVAGAIENLRSARAAAVAAAQGPFQPRDRGARARRDRPQPRRPALREARRHGRDRAHLEHLQRRQRLRARTPVRQPADPGREPARQGLRRRAPDRRRSRSTTCASSTSSWATSTATSCRSRRRATPIASSSTSASAACWTC